MDEGPQKLQDLLATAQRMQQEIGRIQEGLSKKVVEGSAGGGMVVAVANGKQELVSITIEKEIIVPDEGEMLQDLVVAAVNQAMRAAATLAQEEMSKVAGGIPFKIPGIS